MTICAPVTAQPEGGAEPELSFSDPGWIQSALDNTSEWQELKRSLENLKADQTARIVDQLNLSSGTPVQLVNQCWSDYRCETLEQAAKLAATGLDWDLFKSAHNRIYPVVEAYSSAVDASLQVGSSVSNSKSDQLVSLFIAAQALRAGRSILMVQAGQDLPEAEQNLLRSLLVLETIPIDAKATSLAKDVIAETGWPKNSAMTDAQEQALFMAVQHSDRDPAFQVAVLAEMHDNLNSGAVERRQIAYLSDRVSSALYQTQVYGTQRPMCDNGRVSADGLQDVDNVDMRRADMGLPPLSDYASTMGIQCD